MWHDFKTRDHVVSKHFAIVTNHRRKRLRFKLGVISAIPAKYEDNQLNNIENNENSLRSTDLQSIDNIGKNDSAGITGVIWHFTKPKIIRVVL